MNNEELSAAQVMVSLVSRLIYSEPTPEEVSAYAEQRLFSDAPFGVEDEAVARGLKEMDQWCTTAAASPEFPQKVKDLKSDWFQLFVGAGVPDAPSWAGFYLSPNAQLLSEDTLAVRRIYQRFGLRMEHVNSEPDDNLGIMLGFIGHLIALELDDVCDSMRDEAFKTQRDLLSERILPWISAWRYKTDKYARTGFYHGMGELVFGMCRVYAKRFGIEYVAENQSFVISA